MGLESSLWEGGLPIAQSLTAEVRQGGEGEKEVSLLFCTKRPGVCTIHASSHSECSGSASTATNFELKAAKTAIVSFEFSPSLNRGGLLPAVSEGVLLKEPIVVGFYGTTANDSTFGVYGYADGSAHAPERRDDSCPVGRAVGNSITKLCRASVWWPLFAGDLYRFEVSTSFDFEVMLVAGFACFSKGFEDNF